MEKLNYFSKVLGVDSGMLEKMEAAMIRKTGKLRKMVEAQARTIKSQKNHIARLKLHLACLGVDKKPFWKIKKD